MAGQDSNVEKRHHLEQMLDTGRGLVMIHLDPRRDEVQVPPQFTSDPVLRLNLAYGFNLPALDIDDGGVYAMLSFGGRRFGCNMPWSAIFALTMPEEAHRGVVWPEDLPPELVPFFSAAGLEGGAREVVSLEAVQSPEPVTPAGPRLQVVASVPDDADVAEGQLATEREVNGGEPAPAPTEPKRPTLRLVK